MNDRTDTPAMATTNEPLSGKLALALVEVIQESGVLEKIASAIVQVRRAATEFLEANPDFFRNLMAIAKAIAELPERKKAVWSKAVMYGWYPTHSSWLSVDEIVIEDQRTLDAYMHKHLQENWDDITQFLLAAYPERGSILECAFKLHQEQNYIAAIPLFLAQADGLCSEEVGAYLFTKVKQRNVKLLEIQESSDAITSSLLEVLGISSHFFETIETSASTKDLAPNRHGILHGSKEHLDYGTEINSLKAFSLLAFLAFAFSDLPFKGARLLPIGEHQADSAAALNEPSSISGASISTN